MAWIVILSEEEKKLFSFDEKCLYIDGQPCEKKLKGLPFYVFKYLVECSPNFKTCDQIFDHVWVEELGKDKPIDDASIRDKISIIRNYLGDTAEPYLYIETADKAYRSTKKGSSEEEPQRLFTNNATPALSSTDDITQPTSGIQSNQSSGIEEDRDVLRKATFLVSRATGKPQDDKLREEIEALIQSWRTSMLEVWKNFSVKQKMQHICDDYFELLVEYDNTYSKTTKT